jgi:hypothetical protein
MAGNDTKFPTDSGEIELRAQESSAQINRLLKLPAPRIVRFGAFFAAAIPYGKPKFDVLPSSIRVAAQDVGFRPNCYMWWGHWPFPTMVNTPQFMGPEGFVKLESYQGKRFYMRTLFTDGTAISTSNNPKGNGNLRTTHIDSVGDFDQDYIAHLEAVRNYMQAIDARPIYTPDRKGVQASFAVFNRLQFPTDGVITILIAQSTLIALLSWLIVLLVGS